MNPQQNQPPQNDQSFTATPNEQAIPPSQMPKQKKSPKKLALLFLVGPTVLILIAISIAAISNLTNSTTQSAPASGELFGDANPISAVLNVVVFLLGALGIFMWLPGIIIGVILMLNKGHHAKN
ncbi:MAG TPA: hypothetical protein VFT59_03385 [Candidatus Saccharimonadales bacterium]|nr:hypothetical protein [Candidatus Saccharimonadales bacterium]